MARDDDDRAEAQAEARERHYAASGITDEDVARSERVVLARGGSLKAGGQSQFPTDERLTGRAYREARAGMDSRANVIAAKKKRKRIRTLGVPREFTSTADWHEHHKAIMEDPDVRAGKEPKEFLMRIRKKTSAAARREKGMTHFRPHIVDCLDYIVCFYPEYRTQLLGGKGIKEKGSGILASTFDAPTVVSPFDRSLQRLVVDHVEVHLTGDLVGYTDYYLLGLLESDCNGDEAWFPTLEEWGAW